MNPKWILVLMAAVFVYGVAKKMTRPEPLVGTPMSVSTEQAPDDEDKDEVAQPPTLGEPDVDAWPPVGDSGSVSSAVNYYVVLDGSGSMARRECAGEGGRKIEVAIEAVRNFVKEIPVEANVGLAVFDLRDLSERVPIGADNRDAISQALGRVRAGEGTPLRSAVHLAYDRLTKQASKQLGYGEYHLVVVTDGKPDPREEDPTEEVNKILADSPVVLHTIGFCIDPDHVLNQPGRAYYASASNPEELQSGLKSVLAEAPTFDAATFAAGK
jgi:hypothetical protein